ncbi:MAG: entericidin A/B family lipoprotein [Arenimonas sp.]|uniref:entericidin A/B family lipoprotein n=1 Tax=Arenimonas sp. TaxID=1872635 RepID=UPI0025BF4BE8|nr:entericidin A/B family lipoprotein [Arenimonas sp.]MBW8369056.1 entericidin A/B family lipoprotein [Arenimonas sp.]
MKTTLRTFAALALLGFALGSLTACNTISGAGQDVKKAGEVIEETAEDAKN